VNEESASNERHAASPLIDSTHSMTLEFQINANNSTTAQQLNRQPQKNNDNNIIISSTHNSATFTMVATNNKLHFRRGERHKTVERSGVFKCIYLGAAIFLLSFWWYNFRSNAAFVKNALPQETMRKVQTSKRVQQQPWIDFGTPQVLRPALRPHHSVYKRGWDEAPIVMQEYKLIFFTVPKIGSTVMKQLFRRMTGYQNWNISQLNSPWIPHNPEQNGLKYLSDYSIQEANRFLTRKDWTRAIFLRDPKERTLSAYLDKVLHENGKYIKNNCCGIQVKLNDNALNHRDHMMLREQEKRGGSREQRLEIGRQIQKRNEPTQPKLCQTLRQQPDVLVTDEVFPFESFLKQIVPTCKDPHWMPQKERMDEMFWPYINFVGNLLTVEADTRRLLEHIGAWDRFGAHGWDGGSIFASNTNSHVTTARDKMQKYYTPELEAFVENFFRMDYNHPMFNFTSS
jgi:hypothetical protein